MSVSHDRNEGLFRLNAVSKQSSRLEGAVVISRPVSSKILFSALLMAIVIALVFLINASFHRKETVVGYLSLEEGLSKVLAPTTGVLEKIFVSSGDRVEKGQPIALIHSSRQLASGVSVANHTNASIRTQLALLDSRMKNAKLENEQQVKTLEASIAFNQKSLDQKRLQISHASERITIQSNRYNNMLRIHESGAISKNEAEFQREQLVQLKQQKAELEGHAGQQASELARMKDQLNSLPSEHAQRMALMKSEKTELDERLVTARANSEWLITAPFTGTITNLADLQGSSVRHQQYLLTIVPDNSTLQAVLLVPSRAYGFVKHGQNTKLRFDAFPYQRFGLFDGQVTKTSRYIVMPGEVDMPVSIQTPVYKVEVTMASQQISAYGQSVPLQPGMTISADIVLEERSLLSWLFEPIISLKGRV